MDRRKDLITHMFGQAARWREAGDKRYLFLHCYAMMTQNMLRALEEGQFRDREWVAHLLQLFADYYFVALEHYECGEDCVPRVWLETHNLSCEGGYLGIQHLLLGVNAHINYDLVLALKDVLLPEWDSLGPRKREERYFDHTHVNRIIARTIDVVQDEVIEQQSPWMDLIDRLMGRTDEWLISRLISNWREEVWVEAIRMITASDAGEEERLRQSLEGRVLKRAKLIMMS